MPEDVKRRFVQIGNKYHFPDGERAFTDHGSRLTSPSENTEVIKTLVSIAHARGWSEIAVTGTERFRKEAWFAARMAGLDVRNYAPTEFEQGRLVRALARGQESQPSPPPRPMPSSVESKGTNAPGGADAGTDIHSEPRERQRGLQIGKLVDHGPAPYRHDSRNAPSYFVRIETEGHEREIWGVDLQRALKESLTRPQIGDEIGLRSGRREAVKVWQPERDSDGSVLGGKQIETHRNAWVVEKRELFRERAQASRLLRDERVDQQQAVKQHPELVGTYLQLHAAELAAKSIRDPEDQRRFVSSVRRALADSVARGEPLPPVRLRDAAVRRPEPRAPSPPAVAR
jgi:putative DNA primase/helicase